MIKYSISLDDALSQLLRPNTNIHTQKHQREHISTTPCLRSVKPSSQGYSNIAEKIPGSRWWSGTASKFGKFFFASYPTYPENFISLFKAKTTSILIVNGIRRTSRAFSSCHVELTYKPWSAVILWNLVARFHWYCLGPLLLTGTS